MRLFILTCLAIISVSCNNYTFAEVVKTKNGNVYKGDIVSINDKLIGVKTNEGLVKVKRDKINEIKNDDVERIKKR